MPPLTPHQAARRILNLMTGWFGARAGGMVERESLAKKFAPAGRPADLDKVLAYAARQGWVALKDEQVCLQQAGEDLVAPTPAAAARHILELVIFWFKTGVGQIVMIEDLVKQYDSPVDLRDGLSYATRQGWLTVNGEQVCLQQAGDDAHGV